MSQPAAPSSTHTLRTVAIVATVVALLGISIPFTWVSHAQPEGEPITAPLVEPVAAHEVTQPAGGDGAACVADAKPATDFTLPTLDGKQLSLGAHRGKVVLLNFWATWCGPCKAEIPGFVELQQQYKNDLVVIGLSVDDTAEKARPFVEQYKVNYPIVLGVGRDDIQDAYGPIYGIPASFLISRDGKVCKRHLGIAPKAQFEREIKALL
ncbi:MAG: TlpA family protein disulfide reductase [Vicinamibacterales bacterium]